MVEDVRRLAGRPGAFGDAIAVFAHSRARRRCPRRWLRPCRRGQNDAYRNMRRPGVSRLKLPARHLLQSGDGWSVRGFAPRSASASLKPSATRSSITAAASFHRLTAIVVTCLRSARMTRRSSAATASQAKLLVNFHYRSLRISSAT